MNKTKITIDIPEHLIAQAMEALDVQTADEAVKFGLAMVLRHKDQKAVIRWIAESGALADLNDPEVRASAWR